MYEEIRNEDIRVFDFASAEHGGAVGNPSAFRNTDWMVLGPFVMQTEGAFETEYLYERDLILEPDYLAADGGERNIRPYIGLCCHNDYLGGQHPVWKEGLNKWNMLRFDPDDGDSSCDEALFMTEQRNCIFYAAVYVRCQGEQKAVLSYENSGCRLFLNGTLISDTPFGRVKGINTMGVLVPVTFQDGLNLLLFKLRPGYICDTVDLSMSNLAIWPCAAKTEDVILTYPASTAVFTNRDEIPRQIFPCFAASFRNAENVRMQVEGEQPIEIGDLPAGTVQLVRAQIPTENKTVQKNVRLLVGDAQSDCIFTVNSAKAPSYKGTEYVQSSFHFDTTYHQEQHVYAMGAIYILREMLCEMHKDPSFKGVISELDYLHPYYSIYPHDRDFLKQQFIDGKAEADCFYNQPNELTSGGEGIVRNMLYGQLYHRDVLGRLCYVYSPGDVFGHFNQMSQICKKGDCTGVMWYKHILGFWPGMRHVSPDGSSLIHIRGGIDRDYATQKGLTACSACGTTVHSVPGTPMDGHTEWFAETSPRCAFGVPSDLHNDLAEDETRHLASGQDSPFALTGRDMALYHSGTTLTRTDFKQANRLAENLLISAEKFSVFAALLGAKYPEKALDKAWRQILCGQHHDSITGTNNEISFVDLMIEYREAVELAADVLTRSAAFIASKAQSNGQISVPLFNPHAWDRTEYMAASVLLPQSAEHYALFDDAEHAVAFRILDEKEAEGGILSRIYFKASVPALGFAIYGLHLRTADSLPTASAPCSGTEHTIENAFFRIRVDENLGGGIVSIWDKTENKEIIDPSLNGPANRIIALKETHNRMEAQHEFYTTGHRLESTWMHADVQSFKCEAFEQLIVRYELGNVVHVTQEITLHEGAKRIDFVTRCDDYREEDDLFCVTFPTTLKGAKPVFDDRFAPQVRNESLRTMEFRTHQYAAFSRCAVYAANQWLDYGPSVTVQLDAQNSIQLGMTQIIVAEDHIPTETVDKLLVALTKKAVPVTVFSDKDQPMVGSQIRHFNEDLYADTRIVLSVLGDENVYAQSLLSALSNDERTGILNQAEQDGIGIAFLRDNDNLWQKPMDVLLVICRDNASADAFAVQIETDCAQGRFVRLPAVLHTKPGLAEDYGVALLNTGNIACSVEHGGMLNLMLFHTAEFYGNVGNVHCGEKLIPERKSHVFTYSLLPHTESYREAEIYKRALELNDPLFSVPVEQSSTTPVLPKRYSFLRADGQAIVTAVKATGAPMASMHGNIPNISKRGLSVRLFEPNGIAEEVTLQTGFTVRSAFNVNLLEEGTDALPCNENVLSLKLGTHEISTVKLMPNLLLQEQGTVLGQERETVEPTYIRSWEHDLGSMPIGFLSVVTVISRNPKMPDATHIQTEVSVANNYTDKAVSGKAVLALPNGWTADTTEFAYSLNAGEHIIFPVTFEKPNANAKGIVRLTYAHDGQQFTDLFEVGYFDPKFTLELADHSLVATVENPTEEELSGELWLASPIETWGCMGGFNPFGRAEIGPSCLPIVLKPGEKKKISVPVHGDESLSWYAVGKLCCNGRIHFSGVEKKGPRHCVWAHILIDDIMQEGSLRPLLEL